jgi:DNA mismatch endonuclease (patch repair protein)
MADNLTTEQRRHNMSRIRSKNTAPEMIVRSFVHRLGYRYRLHGKNLPGKPDLVFASRKKIILVHGCFWHMHDCSYGKVIPKSNAEYWQTKRLMNRERDRKHLSELEHLGWETLIVWECMTKPRNVAQLPELLAAFLD